MKDKHWKRAVILLLLLCLLPLCACRVRYSTQTAAGPGQGESNEGAGENSAGDALNGTDSSRGDQSGGDYDPEGINLHNPAAQQRVYDAGADAEIIQGAESQLFADNPESDARGADKDGPEERQVGEDGQKEAVLTLPADEADQMGIDEEADSADAILTYYSVLVEDRLRGLFVCKKLDAYWETPEDHRTVYRTSLEHSLMTRAGLLDVSNRLLEENLRVDDGWVIRKNPGLIVKVVPRSILGTGVMTEAAAATAADGLIRRPEWTTLPAVQQARVLLISEEWLETRWGQTASVLLMARTAYPELFADVNWQEAWMAMAQEAAGTAPEGIYAYVPGGG